MKNMITKAALPAAVSNLGTFTSARVSLGRSGTSISTRETLDFVLDHALARDAVYASLSLPTLQAEIRVRGLQSISIRSAAPDRKAYLRRPNLGRTLSEPSVAALTIPSSEPGHGSKPRLTLILADGLSALATDRHALPVVDALLPLVRAEWEITAIVLAEQARVALGDQIGAALTSQLTVMLIGERPGLTAADSLGAYITWNPRPGRSNAERNCISNIHSNGLLPSDAAERIAFFLCEACRLKLTGTALKDPNELTLRAGRPASAKLASGL